MPYFPNQSPNYIVKGILVMLGFVAAATAGHYAIDSGSTGGLYFKEGTAAGTPTAGDRVVYAKSDGIYMKSSAGLETALGGAGAPLTLTGSTDSVQLDVKGYSTQTNPLVSFERSTGVNFIDIWGNSGSQGSSFEMMEHTGSTYTLGLFNDFTGGELTALGYGANGLAFSSAYQLSWNGTANDIFGSNADTGLKRSSAGIVGFTNGGSGSGGFAATKGSSIVGSADEVQWLVKGNGTQTGVPFDIQLSNGNHTLQGGNIIGSTGFGGIYFGNQTASATNVNLAGDATYTIINTPNNAGGYILFRAANGNELLTITASTSAPILSQMNGGLIAWANSASSLGTLDTALARVSAGIFTATDSSTGAADYQAKASLLTAGTLTETNKAFSRKVIHRYDWTNAMVVAIGAVHSGDITVCTLPAKTVVTNAYVVITGAATFADTLTVALGRVSANYIDYVVASDAKAAANTVYGDASAERGTNLTGYDLPSYTGTTAVKLHFDGNGTNLTGVTTSTGAVYLETMTIP